MTAPKSLPDELADHLIALIYVGELAPGRKLPSERLLVDILDVDRTSLRLALAQLNRMRLIEVRPRSGLVVKDFRAFAGLDFYASVLSNPGLFPGTAIVIESIEIWLAMVPALMPTFRRTAKLEAIERVEAIARQQLELFESDAPRDEIIALELEIQEIFFGAQIGFIMSSLINASRSLRTYTIGTLFDSINLKTHIEHTRAIAHLVRAGQGRDKATRDKVAGYFTTVLSDLKNRLEAQIEPPRYLNRPFNHAPLNALPHRRGVN